MTTIDLDMLSHVTGGRLVLRPGAVAGSPDPLIRSRPGIGLQPGATADTRNPIIVEPPRIGLQPGATADTPNPVRVFSR